MRLPALALSLLLALPAYGHECECECECCDPPPAPVTLELLPVSIEPGTDAEAPAGYVVEEATVTAWADRTVYLATGAATGAPTGVVVTLSGSTGTDYITEYNTETFDLFDDLRASGYEIVHLRHKQSWTKAPVGEPMGPALLSGVAVSVVDSLADRYPGVPLITVGQSAGSAQLAYALTDYGLDGRIARAVWGGGPPWCDLAGTCMAVNPHETNPPKLDWIDEMYGYRTETGPAELHDPAWIPVWDADSIAYGGTDYSWPTVVVRMVVGANDSRHIAGTDDLIVELSADPANDFAREIIPSTNHNVFSKPAGRAAILAAITE